MSRLIVKDLPSYLDEARLKAHFSSQGLVTDVRLMRRPDGTSRRFGFVSYSNEDDAKKALQYFNRTFIDTSRIQVDVARKIEEQNPKDAKRGSGVAPPDPSSDVEKSGKESAAAGTTDEQAKSKPQKSDTLKQSKLKERRAMAAKDFNWSTLYMNPDAVATSVADRLGISKADILNPDTIIDGDKGGSSAAVRLALAETRVIQETKEFLTAHGINLDSFEGAPAEKSETTMLVKNIPYGTTPDEIRALFARHGEVAQVLLPPAGTLAIVQMTVPSEAKVAFRALVYRRFKDSVLYLEKAPSDLFLGGVEPSSDTITAVPQRAQKAMDGFLLDGHTLNVKFAKRGHDADDAKASGGGGGGSKKAASSTATKIIIKNLPFETTKKDVRELFAAQGQVRSVRLPKRIDNRPRGFAFVDFVSHREAEAAKEALKHTRLLGRHLVIGWAEEENEAGTSTAGVGSDAVERQRAKEAASLGSLEADPSLRGRKRKLRMNESDIADAVAAEKKRRVDADDSGDED
ncbi:hypothetical protein A4X09_0g6014 [Tilletia walkeri]|uniref:RRM domain-containing protein n=1 Tax=Tilletia walkeri TaxID=117179 RepID=A0A8X7N6D5_9BASI|nr:hypothetical protein A4X09_0g6014 [Tilletia walkeri]